MQRRQFLTGSAALLSAIPDRIIEMHVCTRAAADRGDDLSRLQGGRESAIMIQSGRTIRDFDHLQLK